MATPPVLVLRDGHDVADLTTFVSRAKVADPGGAVRLTAVGSVLAVTVCVLPGGGLLGSGTVLALRALALGEGADVDVVVDLAALADRLARLAADAGPQGPRLSLPPVPRVEAWAALAPPRTGWTPAGSVPVAALRETARAGIAELGGGGRVDRALVWGRPVAVSAVAERPPGGPTVPPEPIPAGVAFAAHALGLIPRADPAAPAPVFRHGRWVRVSLPAGQVLAR